MKLSAGLALVALAAAAAGLHGRFLHMTDLHPDELYRVHASPTGGAACHRGRGAAGRWGAEKTGCDAPFTLVDATLAWAAANLRDGVDFVVWTGDSAWHDSDARSSTRTAPSRADGGGVGKLAVPVVPSLGNNDVAPHNALAAGSNRWLRAYADDVWRRFVPARQRRAFARRGAFSVDVVLGRLAVVSLNTLFLNGNPAAGGGCARPPQPGHEHLEWLRRELRRLRRRGLKAILVGHVPPARTGCRRAWHESCWQRYTLWLRQFRDVVASVFGHMNVDHFLLHDIRQLDLAAAAPDSETTPRQGPSQPAVSVQPKADYLGDLRDQWSDLPDALAGAPDDDAAEEDATRHKYRSIGGRHAERYHLSFVSPSLVPNYLPTLRVFEYNITGLEDATPWEDPLDAGESPPWPASAPPTGDDDVNDDEDDNHDLDDLYHDHDHDQEDEPHLELRRWLPIDAAPNRGDRGRGHLVVPAPPARASLPGPAHSAQPLSLTGYVQYYANLTRLNGDGDGGFAYQVEYRTSEDGVYGLRDLTVGRYLRLAYRMRREAEDTGHARVTEKKKNKSKNKEKKKKHGRERNKTWLHFLSHAFVQTVPREELEKM